MPITSIPLLNTVPVIDGQYADGRDAYNIPLPVPGAPLQSVKFGVVTYNAMLAAMNARKTKFDTEQAESLFVPATLEIVGYVVEDLSLELECFYQLRMPHYAQPPAPYDSAYPEEPAVYTQSYL